MSTTHVFVGLDVGGSTTEFCAASDEGSDRIHGTGPGANLQQEGPARTAQILADVIREALPSGDSLDCLCVCAGVAGAGRSEDQNALATPLRRELAGMAGRVRVAVVHDATIALDAAFGTESGVVVIAGTGSIICARTPDSTVHRAGGWGPRFGDKGSGYAVGRAGLRAVAAELDGGPETQLRTRLFERFDLSGGDALLRRVYDEDVSLPEVAPLVLELADDDPVAGEIVEVQTAGLAQQVEWVRRRADTVLPRVALHGGLFQNDQYAHRFRRQLLDRLPGWTVESLDERPCFGALRRARRLEA